MYVYIMISFVSNELVSNCVDTKYVSTNHCL